MKPLDKAIFSCAVFAYLIKKLGDRAISDIKQASIDDGKNLNDHPPIDTSLNEQGRFHKALELLKKAHHDIAGEEDNAVAQGLQHRALADIDQAHHIVKEIIDSW